MFGIVIAFENYVPYSGVLGSQWVGLKWFQYFFEEVGPPVEWLHKEEVAQEGLVAVKPAFLLQKMEEDDAAEHLLDIIVNV